MHSIKKCGGNKNKIYVNKINKNIKIIKNRLIIMIKKKYLNKNNQIQQRTHNHRHNKTKIKFKKDKNKSYDLYIYKK